MHRPKSDFSLQIDTKDIYQIRTEKQNASDRRLLFNPARALAEGLPCQDQVWITTRFHKDQFDEMRLCKLDSNEFALLF